MNNVDVIGTEDKQLKNTSISSTKIECKHICNPAVSVSCIKSTEIHDCVC